MNAFLAAAAVFALFAILVARHIVIVPPGYVYLVERLGKHAATFQPGWNILMPFADRVAFRIRLDGERVELTEPFAATLELRVVDPRKACYDVADFRRAAAEVARRVAADEAAQRGQPASIFDRQDLAAQLQTRLAEPLERFGLEVVKVEVRST